MAAPRADLQKLIKQGSSVLRRAFRSSDLSSFLPGAYADVEAGKKEYESTRDQYPDLGYDITTVGLGAAFKVCSDGKGMLVPGVSDFVHPFNPPKSNNDL